MLFLTLMGCDGAAGGTGVVDTTDLWNPSEGRFQAYRYTEGARTEDATDTATLGETELQSQYTAGGCSGGGGWRVELRVGDHWENAAPAGALHFSDATGLALCGYEDAGEDLSAFDPPVALWVVGEELNGGDVVASGERTATVAKEDNLATYFGVFPSAVSFTLGGGARDGWVLHMAPDVGLVLLEGGDFTADLIYVR